MKTDIFNGKIKKEYFSYILVSVILVTALFITVGGGLVYVAFSSISSNSLGECITICAMGTVFVLLGLAHFFLIVFVIRNYPKYEKIRRVLINSDIYFTGSTSKEYYGRGIGWSAWRARKAFEIVTTCAESEKRMGKKSLDKYKLNLALSLFVSAFAIVFIVLTAIFKPAGTLFVFIFVCILLVCLALIVHFLKQALFTALMSPCEDIERSADLSSKLRSIAVRKNNKKLKFWYRIEQLEEIEKLVRSASKNAELKLEKKRNKFEAFTVFDTLNSRVVFTGYFI